MNQPPKILIVDDNPTNLDVMEAVIKKSIQADLILAESGDEALRHLQKHDVALAILDVNMPGMSGFELAEVIQKNKWSKHLPIIFLSADFTDDQNIFLGYTKGAVDYIIKPFNSTVLLSKISVFLDLYEQRKLLEEEIAKRTEVEKELRLIQGQLEDRVKERTEELSNTNERLREEINERISIQEKLSLSEKKFRSMIESMEDMAYISDSNRKIIYLNPAMVKFLGRDATGEICHKALHCMNSPCSWCTWQDLRKERPMKYMYKNPSNDRYYHVSNSITRQEEGITHKLTIFRDITAEKETELNLDIARRKAEEANLAKSEFLANISHELRTPLHHVLAFAKFGIDRFEKTNREKLKHFFETIFESGENLLFLVNDLLDIAKLESGKFEFVFEPTTIDRILKMSLHECQTVFEAKGVELILEEHSFDTNLICDGQRIKQVFQNLLSNAAKFTPEGKKVFISVKQEEICIDRDENSDPEVKELALQVLFKDQGIGIPKGELESIFDKFIQSSKSRTEAGGTGLGLAICREIVRGHHGSLVASHNKDEGTTFSVTLPVAQNKNTHSIIFEQQ